MITLTGVKKTYKDKIALDIPEFTFRDGIRYALVGANGSGKSTLIKLIAGIIKSDGGGISNDKSQKTVYMPQKPYAFNMSVKANLKIAAGGKDADALLEKLKISHLKRKNAARLSGGETQKMALARAALAGGDILLLDEPTSAMDMESAALAENLILEEYAGKTVIFATHSITQAERLADEIIFLDAGQIIEILPAKDFRTLASNPLTKLFVSRY